MYVFSPLKKKDFYPSLRLCVVSCRCLFLVSSFFRCLGGVGLCFVIEVFRMLYFCTFVMYAWQHILYLIRTFIHFILEYTDNNLISLLFSRF